jgi:hypothetical protein
VYIIISAFVGFLINLAIWLIYLQGKRQQELLNKLFKCFGVSTENMKCQTTVNITKLRISEHWYSPRGRKCTKSVAENTEH